MTKTTHGWTADPREVLRWSPDLATDHDGKPGWGGTKAQGRARLDEITPQLADLQERLFAQARTGNPRSVLLIAQGMDTAGKGAIARHVLGRVDPRGLAVTAFGVPTERERAHHFLWRVKQALPQPGRIGFFDRSHYDDVLVGKVAQLAGPEQIEKRYGEITRFERRLVDSGTAVVKVALMVGRREQAERLRGRIDDPQKRWKYSPGDPVSRAQWESYRDAYETMFERTSTSWAPWYVVPADRAWYARLAVAEILYRTLGEMDPQWPTVRWRPEVQRRHLAELVTAESAEATPSPSGTHDAPHAETPTAPEAGNSKSTKGGKSKKSKKSKKNGKPSSS